MGWSITVGPPKDPFLTSEPEHAALYHEAECEHGHFAYSGDRDHHVNAANFGPCWCGSRNREVRCPPGCLGPAKH